MLISDLKNNIVNNNIRNFYIFTGEEEGIMDIYIRQICKKLGLTIKWADSIQEVSKQLNLKSLVKVRYLYLVRRDNAFKSDEKLWEMLKNGISGQYIILIQPEIDKRSSKFFKFFEDIMIKFEKLSTDMLIKYVQSKARNLSTDKIEKLCEWCSNSYSRVMNEVDKIVCLSKATNKDYDTCFDWLVKDNGIHQDKEFDILKYANDVMFRNCHTCLKQRKEVKNRGAEVTLIALLCTSFRNLVLFKNDGGGPGVCARTGMIGWQVKCALDFDSYFGLEESEEILLFLQDLDVKIKRGLISQEFILDYLLARVL